MDVLNFSANSFNLMLACTAITFEAASFCGKEVKNKHCNAYHQDRNFC